MCSFARMLPLPWFVRSAVPTWRGANVEIGGLLKKEEWRVDRQTEWGRESCRRHQRPAHCVHCARISTQLHQQTDVWSKRQEGGQRWPQTQQQTERKTRAAAGRTAFAKQHKGTAKFFFVALTWKNWFNWELWRSREKLIRDEQWLEREHRGPKSQRHGDPKDRNVQRPAADKWTGSCWQKTVDDLADGQTSTLLPFSFKSRFRLVSASVSSTPQLLCSPSLPQSPLLPPPRTPSMREIIITVKAGIVRL